ncbi:hypothetical protein T05_15472 [Trichinella murrelli]|uniref:Uncharacterized protein n=1 Tax=Trichinella murrelli TaxID=144512 RepID=A0A0V0T5I0_9BILA|nr:hypothetical protein T05_15472 [Trichinella murrelli]
MEIQRHVPWGFILKVVKVFVCTAHCRAATVGLVFQKIYVQWMIKNLHENFGKQAVAYHLPEL